MLQKFANFQKIQLDYLVDFEKCCKTRIYLQRSASIQTKASEILLKVCQKFATTLRVHYYRPLPGFPSWAAGSTPPARPPRRRTWAAPTIAQREAHQIFAIWQMLKFSFFNTDVQVNTDVHLCCSCRTKLQETLSRRKDLTGRVQPIIEPY